MFLIIGIANLDNKLSIFYQLYTCTSATFKTLSILIKHLTLRLADKIYEPIFSLWNVTKQVLRNNVSWYTNFDKIASKHYDVHDIDWATDQVD